MDEKTLTVEDAVLAAARAAKDAQPVLARLHRADKDALLMAMAEALRNGQIGVMDYMNIKNIEADTQMRGSLGKMNDQDDNNRPNNNK